ncbi:hypothetical protein M408DRAFT_330051 [Serendipita vermifera MAFF 305830]|uniref:Uncharacterized protein n=1 Tax=Serendipita vermifera MAFF 305830 TaxID=933852 RepID=A0A0C3B554_SERVB|nr:hypothetical protein M408DRAFT_330051 [Serendipita vermifera MAFF 305830]
MDSLYGAQPFEELANNEPEPTSPTSLEDFYREQEKKDLERRLSRKSLRRRKGRSKSFASTTSAGGPVSPESENPPTLHSPGESGLPPLLENANAGTGTPPNEEEQTPPGSGTPTPGLAGTGTAATANQQTAATGPPPPDMTQRREYFPPEVNNKPSYEIHNPITPPIPWTNHHLRPPGTPWPPTSQPRKVVVPANWHNSTSLIHQAANANSSNNNSNNNSSTSFVKSSSATNLAPPAIYAPDHVDFLDPSDPWGMRWHHDSRYDVGDFTSSTRGHPTNTWGGNSSPSELPSRRGGPPSTNTNHLLRPGVKSPSPLSQSTTVPGAPYKNGSSISLDTPKQLSRRLSKRNSRGGYSQPPTPHELDGSIGHSGGGGTISGSEKKRSSGFRGLFSTGSSAPGPEQQPRQRRVTLGSSSAPPTGILTNGNANASSTGVGSQNGSRTPSEMGRPPSKNLTAPPPTSYSASSGRSSLTPSPTKDVHNAGGKEKRSSYLGRLVKKFSIIRHSDPVDVTPPNSAGLNPGLKRSVSTANGIYGAPRTPESDGSNTNAPGMHPRYASAPMEKTESPISMVPELRLVGVEEQEREQQQQQENAARQQQQQQRPLSDGRNSPEPQLSMGFGGLVITNPDARASAVSAADSLDRVSSPPIRLISPGSSPSSDMGLPRPAFMRTGASGSAESSPAGEYTPLRVVNGGGVATDVETADEDNGNFQMMTEKELPSPASSSLPSLPPPSSAAQSPRQRSIYTEQQSPRQRSTYTEQQQSPRQRSLYAESTTTTERSTLLLSAIPSIPDLPTISPFNPARSLIRDGAETDSPRSSNMETALEYITPTSSAVSSNKLPKGSPLRETAPAPSPSPSLSSPAPAPSSSASSSKRPSPRPSPVMRSPSVMSVSTASILTTKPTSAVDDQFPDSPVLPVSPTASTMKPPTVTPAVSSLKLGSEYDYEDTPQPIARRRAPSSGTATASEAPSRYGAYYSPGTFPSLAIPPGTPGMQTQRSSILSIENNPLPTPPARLPLPLTSDGVKESSSRERLRSVGQADSDKREREREREQREREREKEKERERERVKELERERLEREKQEWERKERERKDRERQERERQKEQERQERERQERERQERERQKELERQERERQKELERQERERQKELERERQERERQEREQRERQERERQKEKEREREREKEREREREKERERLARKASRERVMSHEKSRETMRAERNEALNRAAAVDLSFSPTFDRPSSRDKRSESRRDPEPIKERRNQSTFRIPGESSDSRPSSRDVQTPTPTSRERIKSQSRETMNANPSRSRVESGSYDVTLSRPTYQSSSRGSDQEETASMRRRRVNSTAGSEKRSGTDSSGREDGRRRTNSTRGTVSAANLARASTVDSGVVANGRRSSRSEMKPREEPRQEDPSKTVIAGLGQNWEVVEAVMIQPHRSSMSASSFDFDPASTSAPAPAPTASPPPPPPSHKKQLSITKDANPAVASLARIMSNGAAQGFPPRTSSRPGFNADGEPIGLGAGPSRASGSSRRQPPPPAKDQPPMVAAISQERLSGMSQRSKTMEPDRSSPKPAVPTRSKSRHKEGTLPANVNLNKPQPPRPPPTPATEQQSLPNGSSDYPKRRDSIQRVRPTSEMMDAAGLGAQEVWEHDRMTARGQSVLLPDGFSVSPPTSHRASATSSVLAGGIPGSPPGAGSAHTVFKVQPPFQARAPPGGYYYPNHQPLPNPLPAPPASILPKTSRNRI